MRNLYVNKYIELKIFIPLNIIIGPKEKILTLERLKEKVRNIK